MRRRLSSLALTVCLTMFAAAQQNTSAVDGASGAVPRLITYSGVLKNAGGQTVTAITGVTFLLYKDAQGGAPLWIETQNVTPDRRGHFSVQLGATTVRGLPADLFQNGEARWLALQIGNEPEQPRVMLVAVPYAIKAADAETVGGLPPSAFVLATAPNSNASADAGIASAPVATGTASVTGGGTLNFIPIFTGASTLGNSALFQSGGKFGVGTTTPATTLDVNGGGTVRGPLALPATAAATATAGSTSQPLKLAASAFNSTSKAPANQTFQWQAAPTGNNTAAPSGTLNLLFSAGTATPASTGLSISNKGILTFASGQKFPGTGAGTVTSVGLTAPSPDFKVTGSPVIGGGTLDLNWTVAPTNANTANAIVKRDASGSFSANSITSTGTIITGTLGVNGNAVVANIMGIGTNFAQATLNVNTGGAAKFDTLLVGNNSTKGLQLRDTGGAVDLESLGVPLFINNITGQNTFLFNSVGIGTSAPQAELNLNSGGTANADTLLLGNNTSRGFQLRDNGNGMDIESIGVPLNVNFVTQQPLFLNPNGGQVLIGANGAVSIPGIVEGTTTYAMVVEGIFDPSTQLSNSAAFSNDVFINGTLEVASTKNFRIDHPLDPLNKYLRHAAIESSEVLNQYSGNVVLDARGEARVEFPDWFAAINEDFRYQLTAIGAPGPNLYIAEEIKDNSFTIAGGKPGTKVSWQVTARRNDRYMRAHPFVVEQDKPERERGYYTDPSLYGAPKEQGIFSKGQITAKKQRTSASSSKDGWGGVPAR